METQNSVAKVLRVIGIAEMIGGFLIALIMGSSAPYWGNTLTVLFSSFVIGMLFIGFAEVIALLQKIQHQLNQDQAKAAASSFNEPLVEEPQKQQEWHPSSKDLEDIQELYLGQKITRIEASPYEDYCIVQIDGENHIEVVELGGSSQRKYLLLRNLNL
jgi:hypothetical protein